MSLLNSTSFSRVRPRLITLGLALALSFPGTANASPEFPSALRAAASMDCTPACTACHTVDPGTRGTASEPFALTMASAGLTPGSEESVHEAYSTVKMEGTDTDGDGAADSEELEAKPPSDPNNPESTPENPGTGICAAVVHYGCSVSEKPSTSGIDPWGFTAALMLFGGGLWARSRRTALRVKNSDSAS